jgi:hypothetical protein
VEVQKQMGVLGVTRLIFSSHCVSRRTKQLMTSLLIHALGFKVCSRRRVTIGSEGWETTISEGG